MDSRPTPVFWGFLGDSDGRECTYNVGDLGWEGPLEKDMQPTLVFLPGELPESDMTEQLSTCSHETSSALRPPLGNLWSPPGVGQG